MPGTHAPLDDIELLDDRDDEPERTADDREHRVVHRPSPLPAREEDEEDLAEADLHRELDLDEDDLDLDDLARADDADL